MRGWPRLRTREQSRWAQTVLFPQAIARDCAVVCLRRKLLFGGLKGGGAQQSLLRPKSYARPAAEAHRDALGHF